MTHAQNCIGIRKRGCCECKVCVTFQHFMAVTAQHPTGCSITPYLLLSHRRIFMRQPGPTSCPISESQPQTFVPHILGHIRLVRVYFPFCSENSRTPGSSASHTKTPHTSRRFARCALKGVLFLDDLYGFSMCFVSHTSSESRS